MLNFMRTRIQKTSYEDIYDENICAFVSRKKAKIPPVF